MRRPPAVARVLERVTATAREHEMFLPGQTVLVAVSGGPDSVCMLESLVRLRRLFKIRLEVFHFDHGLRTDSAADAAYVMRLADRHRLPFHLAGRHVVARQGRVGRGVGAGAAALRDGRGHARDRCREDRDRAHDGRSSRDRAHRPDHRERDPRDERDRAGDRYVGEPAARRDTGRRRGVLSIAPPATSNRSVERRPAVPAQRRSACEGLPGLERAVGRSLREPLVRTAAGLREDADELMRQTFDVLDEVVDETPDGADLAGRAIARPSRVPSSGRVVAQAVYGCGVPCSRADVAGRPRPRGGASGTAARSVLRLEGPARPGVCSPHSSFPPRRRGRSTPTGKGEGVTLIEPSSLSTLTGHVEAYEPDIDRILITGDEIQAKLAELGERIGERLRGTQAAAGRRPEGRVRRAWPIWPATSACRSSSTSWRCRPTGRPRKTSGVVRILKDLDHDLEGLDVLLVEDIVDSGLTLNYLLKNLRARKPASLEVARPAARRSTCSRCRSTSATRASRSRTSSWSATASTTRERYRNLPYIATLRPEAYGGA